MIHYLWDWSLVTAVITSACGRKWPPELEGPSILRKDAVDCAACLRWYDQVYVPANAKAKQSDPSHRTTVLDGVVEPSSPKDWIPKDPSIRRTADL